jgi:type I restriction enzyme R subunit
VKVKLPDGKERTIQHMMMTSFWHPDGTPMSSQQVHGSALREAAGVLQERTRFARALERSRDAQVAARSTRRRRMRHEQLHELQRLLDAEKRDLFDVLAYVAYHSAKVTREQRAASAKIAITHKFTSKQQTFIDFVLSHYVSAGVEELSPEKLTPLLRLKYNNAISDAVAELGSPEEISRVFNGFQKHLYRGAHFG